MMKDGKVDKRRSQGFLTRSIVGRDDDRSGILQMKPMNWQFLGVLRPTEASTSPMKGMKQINPCKTLLWQAAGQMNASKPFSRLSVNQEAKHLLFVGGGCEMGARSAVWSRWMQ